MCVVTYAMASKKIGVFLLGTLPFIAPEHTTSQHKRDRLPGHEIRKIDAPVRKIDLPLSEAQTYYKNFTDSFNPRFYQYEEKNPVILVIEADKGDHKAEVIKVIESTYGSDNPPKVIYVDSNLLNEDAAFSLGELLHKQGVSLSSVRAINFSMGSWFDSTSPTSALAMRSNIVKFKDSIFVHGAGNMSGGQAIYGLTTQSDHAIVVGATNHAGHEKPIRNITETDFTASIETPSSSVDLVMKGADVPIDGVVGRWSKDGKDDPMPRKLTGTSFSAPQVTAGSAKIGARFRDMFVNGLPGRRYKDELTIESMEAKDQRRESFFDSVTLSLLASATMIDPGDRSSVITTPGKRPFDSKGSGFGMPHFGLAERIMFDQMLAAQLDGRPIQSEDYQSYAPENNQVYPRTVFKKAQEEHKAVGGNLLRHNVSVRVPLPLKTHILTEEKNTLSIDIPAFDNNLSTHMLRGSLLFAVEPSPKSGEKKENATYELFIESPDRKTRIALCSFGCEKKELWHTDRPHPIDDFNMVNFRTRAHMLGETAPKGLQTGWRFIVKTTNKDPKDVKVYASGDKMLPVLEITGVPQEQEMFNHHPADASRLGFLSQKTIVENNQAAFDRLEDKLDTKKNAQAVVEDFISGKHVSGNRIIESLPDLFMAAKDDSSLQQVVGLMAHNCFVEPIARNVAERLMHLAKHYESRKDQKLQPIVEAYSNMYKLVLTYEKTLVKGDGKELEDQLKNMAGAIKTQAPNLAQYARTVNSIYAGNDGLIKQEQRDMKAIYLDITGDNLILPPIADKSTITR